MSLDTLHAPPFGLLELDKTGTVIRYSPAAESEADIPAEEVLGRNFFTDFLPAEEARSLKARFQLFMAHGMSIDRVTSTFACNGGQIKVQLLLARIAEKTENGHERLALVRLMPEKD